MEDIVVVGVARTPMGRFGGTLRAVPVYDLGAAAIRAALSRAGVAPQAVGATILGHCRQAGNGPNPVRTASVKAGIPVEVPAMTVNMACPSGMKSVMLACQSIWSGESEIVVAGGMESMSTMPYLLKNARWEGFRLGNRALEDSWSDTVDPLCGMGMGQTAENLAQKHQIGREEQDAFALESHEKAARAQEQGAVDWEIVPLDLPTPRTGSDSVRFERDEAIRKDTTSQRLSRLQPAFLEGGTVTAGNSCSMGDGGVAMVVASRATAQTMGLTPLFSVVAFAQTGVDPAYMGEGPGVAIPRVLAKAAMTLKDIDFIEVNEAFAVQMLANERAVGWDRSRVNVHGGAIALSHPTGISGARILGALYNVLRVRDGETGVASICGGGGVTTAMVIRREN